MDELVDTVARRAGVNRAQASAAIAAVLDHFTAHLPSPVVGRMHALLRGEIQAAEQNGENDDTPP